MTAADTKPTPAQTTKSAAAAEPKEIKMATPKIDTSNMSVEEMLKLSKELADKAHEASQKLFDDTINFLDDKLKAMGRTKVQAAMALHRLMSEQEQKDHAAFFRATSSKKSGTASTSKPKREGYADEDSTGARPEVGKEYKLPDGTKWKKLTKQGASKKEFIAAVKGGAKWADLLVK